MTSMKRLLWSSWAAFAIVAALIAACGGKDNGSVRTDEMAPADQQVLRLRLSGEPKGLDPHTASFTDEISITRELFSSLFRYDADLQLQPDLASEMPTVEDGGISRDGKTYTIRLRKDAKWSDGQPLTSLDVVYSLKRMLDPKLAAPYSSFFSSIEGAKAYSGALGTRAAPKNPSDAELSALRDAIGIVAKDDRTVVFTLTAPNPSFLQQLALVASAPVRKDVIEKFGDSWTEASNLIGSGPFVLKEWVHKDHLLLEPNSNWHLGQPKLSRVELRVIEDDAAAFASYLAGELDAVTIPPANRREATTPGSALNDQLVRKPDLNTFALMFNMEEKPWDNVKVRQAFGTAFDRKAFVDATQQGVGQVATSWIPPGMPGYDPSAGKQYDFDPAKAKQLLADAGYPNGAGLPKPTFILRASDTNRIIAQFIQDQFKKNLGVDIEVELVDNATYGQRFQRGQFNFTLISWSADWPYPDNWLVDQFSSKGGLNVYHYQNAKVEDLLQKAAAETDAKKQLDLYSQVHKTALEDAALVPIFHRETFLAVKPRVRDLVVTGLDGSIKGDWNLWRTWIAKS